MSQGAADDVLARTSPRDLEPDSPSMRVLAERSGPDADRRRRWSGLDTRGRLVEFRRLPPQREDAAAEPDCDAGLEPRVSRRRPADRRHSHRSTPTWSPKDFADTRAGVGRSAARCARTSRIRVEIGWLPRKDHARCHTVGPWSRARMQPLTRSTLSNVLNIFSRLLWIHRAGRRPAARAAQRPREPGRPPQRRAARRLCISSSKRWRGSSAGITMWLRSRRSTASSSVSGNILLQCRAAVVDVYRPRTIRPAFLAGWAARLDAALLRPRTRSAHRTRNPRSAARCGGVLDDPRRSARHWTASDWETSRHTRAPAAQRQRAEQRGQIWY